MRVLQFEQLAFAVNKCTIRVQIVLIGIYIILHLSKNMATKGKKLMKTFKDLGLNPKYDTPEEL